MTEQLSLIPPRPLADEAIATNISPDDIDANLAGIRPDAAFVRSIRDHGLLQPIAVALNSPQNGRFQLIFGRRRLAAVLLLKRETIRALVFPHGTTRAEVATLVENENRSPNIAADLTSIEALIEQGHSKEDICAATGMRPQTFDKVLRLANLIPELRVALADGRIKPTTAQQAARLSRERQRTLLEALHARGRVQGTDVLAASRVVREAAALSLPDALFAQPVGPSWARQLHHSTDKWLAELPPDQTTIRNLLTRLKDRVAKEL